MGFFNWIKKQITSEDNASVSINNQVIKGNFSSGNISGGDQVIIINGVNVSDSMGNNKSIRGNGIIVEKDFSHILNNIDSIYSNSVFNINVSVSSNNPSKMTIKGEENIIETININNQHGELSIGSDKSFNSTYPIEIFISVPSLSMIKNLGVGNISGYVEAKEFKIKSASVGNVDLEYHGNIVKINSSGVGNVKLKGIANFVDVKQASVGSTKLTQLNSKKAIIHVEGVGSCDVSCSEHFEGTTSGIGNITVYGHPNVFKTDCSGLGKIKQKNSVFSSNFNSDHTGSENNPDKRKPTKYEL